MDSKLPPTRLSEDLVQSQTSAPTQQFAPRNPVGQPPLNPIVRRPSITTYSTGEIPIRAAPPSQILQRLDSRQTIQSQPQQSYPTQNPNQVPGGQLLQPRIIQQRPIGAPTPQQYQQPLQQQPRIENQNRPQLINRVPAPNPIQPQLINRPVIPPGTQLPQQQQQQLQHQQQLPQQQLINRLPLNRPPIQQSQINPSSGYQPNQQPLKQQLQQQQQQQQQPIRAAGVPQLAPNQYSVTSTNIQSNQNIRVNQPGQYRVPQPQQFQAPIQQRPPTNTFNNPINPTQKLPTHLEEKSKMAAELNAGEKHQPSYIISNSDDVDDVIVRPITQSTVFKNDFDSQPKVQPVQQQQHQSYVGQPPIQRPAPNLTQSEFRQSPQQQQVPIARPPTTSPPNANSPSVLKSSTPEPASRSSIPRPSEGSTNGSQKTVEPAKSAASSIPTTNDKKFTPDNSAKKQNGTSGKADEKGNDDGAGGNRLSHSRASSHKSQEDVMQRSSSRSRMLKLLEKPAEPPKKVSMNKIKVGNAPPPNLRQVRSKIGSLDNATHKPGGGNIKIETKKLEFKGQTRIEAKNDAYVPKGGEKKIISTKLQWNAKSKIGSLDNANHKPGGGDKKILTIKSDFRENAKPKVGSKSANNNNNNDAAAAETVNQ